MLHTRPAYNLALSLNDGSGVSFKCLQIPNREEVVEMLRGEISAKHQRATVECLIEMVRAMRDDPSDLLIDDVCRISVAGTCLGEVAIEQQTVWSRDPDRVLEELVA